MNHLEFPGKYALVILESKINYPDYIYVYIIGLPPLPVTVANEGLGWDLLLKI